MRQPDALQSARIAVAATHTKRQTFPRWEIAREAAANGNASTPARGAKVIPFPGAAAHRAAVVTYPAQLVLPVRPEVDTVPRTTPRERRIGFATAAGLVAVGLLLLLV
jgi:hypothetical protein